MNEDERARFEAAFVATSYLLGRRDADLVSALRQPVASTRRIAERLGAPEREMRARALAAPLGAITEALEARRLL
jgi:hypothetical protein